MVNVEICSKALVSTIQKKIRQCIKEIRPESTAVFTRNPTTDRVSFSPVMLPGLLQSSVWENQANKFLPLQLMHQKYRHGCILNADRSILCEFRVDFFLFFMTEIQS